MLHVMNADGSDIHQISFNQSHDLRPDACWTTARIVFSRWDNAGGSERASHLYAVRPGRHASSQLLYGAQSHATGTDGSDVQFLRSAPDGRTAGCSRVRSRSRRSSSAASSLDDRRGELRREHAADARRTAAS